MQGNGGRYSTDTSANDGDIFLQESYRLITIIDVFDRLWVAVGFPTAIASRYRSRSSSCTRESVLLSRYLTMTGVYSEIPHSFP